MYSSSATTGDFEKLYCARCGCLHRRALPHDPGRTSRGLVGHSMGGYGASRIGMKHPDVFGSLYIMSPCCMSPMGGGGPAVRQIDEGDGDCQRKEGCRGQVAGRPAAQSPGFGAAQYATAAAWAPDPKNPPLYFDLPTKDGVPVPEIQAKFTANSPWPSSISTSAISSSTAPSPWTWAIRTACASMPRKLHNILDSYGIPNSFEIYSGTHTSAVADRFQNHVLPFFSKNLCFKAGCQ